MLGMMAAGLVAIGIGGILLTVGFVCGLIASIFFHVDFASIGSRWEMIYPIYKWAVFIGGSIGGLIWALITVRDKWRRFKADGTEW